MNQNQDNMAYSQKEIESLFETICTEIEKGRALRKVLKDKDMPSNETFYGWVDGSKQKAQRYARACEKRADAIFEEMIDIADDGTNDLMTIVKGDKEYELENKEVTNRSRLRVDTRKWMLSKMMPKKYGDKLDITTDGEKIATPVINMLPKSDEPKSETK